MTPIPGQLYRHYKGNHYRVVGVARCSETLQLAVVYSGANAQLWHRPLEMFNETVEVDGKTVPRFELVANV